MQILTDIFKTKDRLKEVSTNHIFVVDVSGSMYDSLPKMREHIKNNFALLVKPKDTVSIVYFSSKGEYGIVFENQEIHSLKDLTELQKSVDRFLKPLCLTGFLEPIQEAIDVTKRIKNSNINNFIFMTDGYDNQWNEKDIILKCKELPKYFENIVFIEYGFYCNRTLISKMATESNGFHVFSEDYKEYEKTVEQMLTSKLSKNIKLNVSGEFVFYIQNNELYFKDILNDEVLIPEDLEQVYIIDSLDINENEFKTYDEVVKFVLLYMSINKMQSNNTWKILKVLGDVNFIEQYSNCFSKQDYSNILKNIKEAILDNTKRFQKGIDHNLVPKEDAFTIIDLLNVLSQDDNKLMINDNSFNYNRIGAISKIMSKEEKIRKLQDEISKKMDINEIQQIADEISNIEETIEFIPYEISNGVDINTIVYNETRPNISINTKQIGYVEIPEKKVIELNLPQKFETSRYKNFTVVKDGIKNIKVLPVKLTQKTFDILINENIINDIYEQDKTYLIDITKIPLINRNMVKEVSASTHYLNCFELEKLKAQQKVYKYYLDKLTPSKLSTNFIEKYGEIATTYLNEIGIKEYGYSPKVQIEKIGDFYYSKELNIKISGLSNLPTIDSVFKKQTEKKKLNLADTLILEAIQQFEQTIVNLTESDDIIKLIEEETKEIINKVRRLQYEINKVMYSIIIGQTWFKEFTSIDDDSSLDFKYKNIDFKVSSILNEKEIKI